MTMSDDDLIARLRQDDTDFWHCEAADRIEALVKERDQWIEHTKNAVWSDSEELKLANARIEALGNEAVLSKAAYEGVSSLLLSVQQDCIKERQRAERLQKALEACKKYRDAYAKCDRIGTQAVRDLEAKLTKAMEALDKIAGVNGPYSHPFPEASEGYGAFAIVTSREAIAEIKGESHE